MSQEQSTSAVSHVRRRWLMTGAALAVTAGGVGLAWQFRGGVSSNDEALQAFWSRDFVGSDGAVLPLASFRGQPLLVNFWATWCPPCVRELPLINGFAQAQSKRGAHAIQVLGIAVDQAAAVSQWLSRQPLSFPVVLAGAGGVGLTRSLGNINGGLPFTLLLDAEGRVQQRKMGEISEKDLEQWATFA